MAFAHPSFVFSFGPNPWEVLLYIRRFLLPNSFCRSLRSVVLAAVAASLLVVCAFAQNNPVQQVVGLAASAGGSAGRRRFHAEGLWCEFRAGGGGELESPAADDHLCYRTRSRCHYPCQRHCKQYGRIHHSDQPAARGRSVERELDAGRGARPDGYHCPPKPPHILWPCFPGSGRPATGRRLQQRWRHGNLADFDGVGTVPIYLGAAGGVFRYSDLASNLYWPVFGANNATFGDFNGDGNVDLAYDGSFKGNNSIGLDVSLGDGNGSFTSGWKEDEIAVASVLAGDFNRDGNLDLIAGYSSYTYVYLGNGDGTFNLSQTLNFGPTVFRLAGDFNGDGNLDLVLLSDSKPTTISVALGNGDGTFQTPRKIATFDGTCEPFGPVMLINDFNGDGKLDVAFCTPTSIGIMLGNGDGTFQKPVFYPVDAQPQFSFAAGDFNSDGKPDLLVSRYYPTKSYGIEIRLGNGDGTFQPPQYFADNPAYFSGECGIAVGDFNSDGLLDFVFQNGGDGFDVFLQTAQ